MSTKSFLLSGALCCAAVSFTVAAEYTAPTAAELAQVGQWVDTHWDVLPSKKGKAAPRPAGIVVIANHDPVLKRTRGNTPLNLAGKVFARGIYCHANSHLDITLPKPATRFRAVIGVDSNPQTSNGRGSVHFSIRASNEEKFRSQLLREGMTPVEVQVDLAGAREFSLLVDDGGDGISCDQSDWCDAIVEFADGTTAFLDELPLRRRETAGGLPFSFVYGGVPSAEFLKQCELTSDVKPLDAARTQHTLRWYDEKTKLEVRLVGVAYNDFPVVEWTLYFKNTGKNTGTENTPILSNISAADLTLPDTMNTEPVLHHNVGSCCASNDYQPLTTTLRPGTQMKFSGTDGRPSDQHLPYFNLANDKRDGGGTIVVVGWPGQWEAEFAHTADEGLRGQVHFRAGQEQLQCVLLPGEEIRTPLIVLMFWDGSKLRSQNVWRRWFLAHNAPRNRGGQIPPYHWTVNTSIYFWEMVNADTAGQIMFIDGLLERGLFIDYWWMDAGWYLCNGSWTNTGTWEVDQQRFPGGLRPISDHAASKGVKTLVWFEPERVTANSWLTEQHPDWVLGGKAGGLLNLGDTAAREWCIEHIAGLIESEGIGLYRQDFNIAPLGFWRGQDTPNRQGVTENKHVCGYLAFWDELRRRFPNMSIDSCSSGGRRNDLETLRRAIILHRSDNYETTGNQGQSFGIASWTPLFGIGADGSDQYHFRSMMTPFQNSSFDVRDKNYDFAIARKYQADWKRINKYYLADYYPLTSYSLSEEAWLAWQYSAHDGRSGIVQVFKRPDTPYPSCRLKLHNLDPDAVYIFDDLDGRASLEFSGRELTDKGLLLTLGEPRAAVILEYRAK